MATTKSPVDMVSEKFSQLTPAQQVEFEKLLREGCESGRLMDPSVGSTALTNHDYGTAEFRAQLLKHFQSARDLAVADLTAPAE